MASSTKLRHAGDTGYSRGEETRMRIITAALKMFGMHGFEGASTRDIATAAGVNAPALQYYFNNKEGVYIACAEHIINNVHDVFGDALAEGKRALVEQHDDEALIVAFCAIQKRTIDLMLSSDAADGAREFMAREQAGLAPKLGDDLFYQRMSKPIMDVTTAIVGRLLGKAPSDEETILRSAALTDQMVWFQVMRLTTMGQLGWDWPNPKRLQLIKQIVEEHTVTVLRALVAGRSSRL